MSLRVRKLIAVGVIILMMIIIVTIMFKTISTMNTLMEERNEAIDSVANLSNHIMLQEAEIEQLKVDAECMK